MALLLFYPLQQNGMHVPQVWDANLGRAACSFTFPDRVFGVAMSSAAAAHCLIAVVGGDPHVKLCDPATGGFTHSLVGHREPVWAVSWSLDCEYHLVTGGCDGQVTPPAARLYAALKFSHGHSNICSPSLLRDVCYSDNCLQMLLEGMHRHHLLL